MPVNLPGSPPKEPTSLLSPLLQVLLVGGLLVLARWSALQAVHVRTTDQWAYNALSAVSALAGVLFLPFSLAAVAIAVCNRVRRSRR